MHLGGPSAWSTRITLVGAMTRDAIDIREFAEDDLEAVVAFSLRAWEPVFASVQAVLGDQIFLRLHPDWRTSQAETVRSICTNNERDVYVAVVGARPVGFVAVGARRVPRTDGGHRDHRSRPRLPEAGRRCTTHRVRRGSHATLWHGYCGGRNRRRPRARTCPGAVRRSRLHPPANRALLPVA